MVPGRIPDTNHCQFLPSTNCLIGYFSCPYGDYWPCSRPCKTAGGCHTRHQQIVTEKSSEAKLIHFLLQHDTGCHWYHLLTLTKLIRTTGNRTKSLSRCHQDVTHTSVDFLCFSSIWALLTCDQHHNIII